MQHIIFNARFYNTGRRIKSISGRLGPFIFRTYQNGLITAYYSPKKQPKNGSITSQSRVTVESLTSQLRGMTDLLALQITSINTNLPQS